MNYLDIIAQLRAGKTPVLRTWLTGAKRGSVQQLPALPPATEGCYDEQLLPDPMLVILGAGHVAKALCQVASFCGFAVTVIDEREELLTEERYPQAKALYQVSYDDLSGVFPDHAAYYVVATSGHSGDYQCIRQVLKRPFAYAGMIGSRRKVQITKECLRTQDQIPEEILDQLHAPVGLDIGAETPEEIAISIVAELVQTKNTNGGTPVPRDLFRALSQFNCHGVLCTIVAKRGSVPRGVGSKMLVYPDGTICGTIGGGRIEYMAIEHAKTLTGFDLQMYGLTPEENTGMACGGRAMVMFQPIDNRVW